MRKLNKDFIVLFQEQDFIVIFVTRHFRENVNTISKFAVITLNASNPKEHLMEKRIGTITILIKGKNSVPLVNALLSEYSSIILARQGLPLHNRNINVISLVIEGTIETISALTGKIGRLNDVEVKSILTKFREEQIDEQERTEQGIH